MKPLKRFIVWVLILVIVVGVGAYKPPLSTITASELLEVHGIGEVRLNQIQSFILDYPNAKVEDLRSISGVDDLIIDQLKERFR